MPHNTAKTALPWIFHGFVFLLLWGANSCGGGRQGDAGAGNALVDEYGAIIRGDTSRKKIALVFTGDEFGDGGSQILKTLKTHQVKASFFLTGNFYQNASFKALIHQLKDDGHYLGAHSDQHLLYADWNKRDSLLVTEKEFKEDLLANYARMAAFGIEQSDAPYFIAPYEWYNTAIANWTKDLGLVLLNFSPGTKSTADYTYPEMGDRYRSSTEIYASIIKREEEDPHGLNGFILLVHIGTDPRRTDKFYDRLDALLTELKARGYDLVSIKTAMGK
jgi:endoglucanase